MGFFDWSAPLFAAFGDRWSAARLREIAGYIRPSLPDSGGTILDLGGGTGVLSARLARMLNARFVVVDPSTSMTRYVSRSARVEAVNARAEALPFPDDAFDAVVVSDAFHHFPNQEGAVSEIRRVTKRGGTVVMMEFDRRNRPVALVERAVDRHGHLFAPGELCAYLSQRGIDGTCQSKGSIGFDFVGRVSASS